MPPKRSHHVCANCASFQHEGHGYFAQCRRNPPVIVPSFGTDKDGQTFNDTETRFPIAEPDSWCSRWEPIIVVDAKGQPMEQGDNASPESD